MRRDARRVRAKVKMFTKFHVSLQRLQPPLRPPINVIRCLLWRSPNGGFGSILLKKSLESWYLLAMLKTRYSREMRDDGTTAW
jgi:hypothetical protein